jgi:alkylation response protein AidB-like acyl-CoA dehydrogenase
MRTARFDLNALPPGSNEIRAEVREFLAAELASVPRWKRAYTWSAFDAAFSRKVAARGWIGMTWPSRYGGRERSAFERYVVLEEMLAAGAPVGAHWVGDRQTGPMLLRRGTEEQRCRFLPAIARGEIFLCIGMSEPDSGSDLASVRTRAVAEPGGWRVNGTKVWTSNAHHCQFMLTLVRTRAQVAKKHDGLSQLLVDLASPGITIRPIRDLAGGEHFCEVVFEDVLVSAEMLVGAEGEGWAQVTSELSLERSGPERFLSSYPLIAEWAGRLGDSPPEAAALADLGRQVAELVTLRSMSIAVAGMLDAGEDPYLEAALVKDLGAVLEQRIPAIVQRHASVEPRMDSRAADFEKMIGLLTEISPSFSLRGGTREILRGVIARGLGLR